MCGVLMEGQLSDEQWALANKVMERVCAYCGCSVSQVVGKRRHAGIVRIRRVVARTLRRHSLSVAQIGTVMNRDHSTVTNLLWTK